jgi:TP901 family phage tail tape measure protein
VTKTVESRLRVSLIDGVTANAKKAGAALAALQKQATFTSRIGGAVAMAGGAVAAQGRRIGGAMTGFRESLMNPAGLLGSLAALEQGHVFIKFNEHMNRISAATVASAEEMKALQAEIFKVARQHGRKYEEVAGGALQLVKSGKDIHETIGALDATVGAAVATEKSVEHTAETLTDIIYGMGLRVTNQKEAMTVFAQVADVAVAASFRFNQTYDEMSRALAKGAPMARVTGLTLAEIATFAGLSADENFKGAKAGAALASSFIRLMAPTKKARAELAAAGIDLSKFQHATKEAQLGGRALADVLNEELGVDADKLAPKFDKIIKDPKFKDNATMLGKALQAAVAEGLEMDANSPNIEKAREAVDTFVRSAFSKMDMVAVFRELAKQDADANISLINELFGKHHGPAMIALINAFRQELWDRQKKLLDEQTPGAVKRHEHENLKGLSGAVLNLSSAWANLWGRLYTTGGVANSLTSILNNVAHGLDLIAEAGPGVLKAVGAVSLITATSLVAGFAVEALAIAFRGLKLAAVLALAPISVAIATLKATIIAATASVAALGSGLLRLARTATAAGLLFGLRGGIVAIGAAALAALNPVRLLRGALFGVGAGLRFLAVAVAPISAAVAAIAAGGLLIYQNWQGLGAFFTSFGEAFMKALPPGAQNVVRDIAGAVEKIADKLAVASERWAEWGRSLGEAAGGGVASAIAALERLGGILSSLWEKAKGLASALSNLATNNMITRGLGVAPAPAPAPVEGQRAEGGPVRAGRRYLVGERGPELFVPRTPGTIVPNAALRQARGEGRDLGKISVSQVFNFTGGDKLDLAAIRREVARATEVAVNEALRTAQADVGFHYSSI